MTEQLGVSLNWQNSSKSPLDSRTLRQDELHLWWLPLTLNAVQRELTLNLLSDTQRDKYHRRNNIEQKQAYLAGRYHLMTLLAAYNRCEPSDILLRYNRLNKPYLNPNPRDIQFNFTDTNSKNGYMGLFAFCLGHQVGVDIESVDRSSDFEKIAKRRFTDAEQTFIRDTQGKIDPKKALAIWTRKEAYGKATGKGINFTMRDHELINGNEPTLNFRDDADDWRLTQLALSDSHIACVVHQSHTPLKLKGFSSHDADVTN